MATVVVDETSRGAWAKHDELRAYGSDEAALVLLSGWTGLDLSGHDLDAPLTGGNEDAIQSAATVFLGSNPQGEPWTLRDITAWAGIGGRGPVFVGDPGEVADEMQAWVDEADVDGFNLAYAISPGTFEDVVEHLVPELQRRGVHRTEYEDSSLRDRLFGAGDRLPDRHGGAAFRRRSSSQPEQHERRRARSPAARRRRGTAGPRPATPPGRATAAQHLRAPLGREDAADQAGHEEVAVPEPGAAEGRRLQLRQARRGRGGHEHGVRRLQPVREHEVRVDRRHRVDPGLQERAAAPPRPAAARPSPRILR